MEPILPDHTAVLVIDVQRGLFCTEPAPFEAEAVVARINTVIAKARRAGAPVIFIQHDGEPGGEDVVPFTEGGKLHSKLEIRPGDPVIRKTTGDAFYGSTLEAELRSRGITTLLLIGYATDFCVDATLRSAASKDFGIIVVADAHTTSDNPVLKAEVVRKHHNWAWANAITKRGVTVLRTSQVKFGSGGAVLAGPRLVGRALRARRRAEYWEHLLL
jgi:nicotinamidase-related amidase